MLVPGCDHRVCPEERSHTQWIRVYIIMELFLTTQKNPRQSQTDTTEDQSAAGQGQKKDPIKNTHSQKL